MSVPLTIYVNLANDEGKHSEGGGWVRSRWKRRCEHAVVVLMVDDTL